MAGLDPNAPAMAALSGMPGLGLDLSSLPGIAGAHAPAPAAAAALTAVQTAAQEAAAAVRELTPTRVLVLLNMVAEEDFVDDQDYSDVSASLCAYIRTVC